MSLQATELYNIEYP